MPFLLRPSAAIMRWLSMLLTFRQYSSLRLSPLRTSSGASHDGTGSGHSRSARKGPCELTTTGRERFAARASG